MNEERSILRLGRSLGITLPSEWCEENHVKKGNLVDIYQLDDRIVICSKVENVEIHEESIQNEQEENGITNDEVEGATKKEKPLDIEALVRAKIAELNIQ